MIVRRRRRRIGEPYEGTGYMLKPVAITAAFAQEMGERETALGLCEYVRIGRHDGKPMSWREVQDEFNEMYPGRWAVQMNPPADELLDEANLYHLFVLLDGYEPQGLNIRRR